jgi:hypothetical protein
MARQRASAAAGLAGADLAEWRRLPEALAGRPVRPAERGRFRRAPEGYRRQTERVLHQSGLEASIDSENGEGFGAGVLS